MRCLFFLLALAAVATPQDLGRDFGLPLLASVPTPPIPVRADGKYLLVYELHLIVGNRKPVDLQKLEVWGSKRIAVLEDGSLAGSIRHSADRDRITTRIAAGNHAVICLFLSVEEVPASIHHRITGRVGDETELLTLKAATVSIRGEPVRIHPPLRGDRWVAFNGPSNSSHHRRSWLATGDRAIVPQRFAIDFARLYPDGQLTHGDPQYNQNHASYGAELLAVADALVVQVTDGVPENTPSDNGESRQWTLQTVAGNAVVLDLGHGRYGFYAHLQPGSLRVKKGDRVSAGQEMGLLGNSGNSSGPHLHFGVADGPAICV